MTKSKFQIMSYSFYILGILTECLYVLQPKEGMDILLHFSCFLNDGHLSISETMWLTFESG